MSARSLKKKTSESSLKASDRQSPEPVQEKPAEEGLEEKTRREIEEKKRQYWVALGRKTRKGRDLADKAVISKEQSLNNQILRGRYQIKELQWPTPEQNTKNSRTKLTTSAVLLKKDLEGQLQGIESRINQELKDKASKMMSEEDHQNFMKKIEHQRRQQEQRRLQGAKAEQQHRQYQASRLRQEQERIDSERKTKKKQQLMEKLRNIEEQRKKQQEAYQQQQQQLKEKVSEKIMADKMEGQYYHRQSEFLEEKKKKLAEIRTLHKPIDKNELDAFSQKIDQIHQDKQKARENKEVLQFGPSVNKFYRSAFYKRVQQDEKGRIFSDSRHDDDVTKRKQMRDKLKRYAQQVREDHKPSIDEKKAEQIKFRNQSTKPRAYSSSQQMENPRKLGLRYLEYNKINHKLLGGDQDQSEEEEDKKGKKMDYLAELRERNKKIPPITAERLIERLDRKHLPKEEKAKQILDFTQRLEMKARRRQQVEKIGGGVSEELDSLYLQAIEAKLSLLELDHQ